jgi:hypothetical protein
MISSFGIFCVFKPFHHFDVIRSTGRTNTGVRRMHRTIHLNDDLLFQSVILLQRFCIMHCRPIETLSVILSQLNMISLISGPLKMASITHELNNH